MPYHWDELGAYIAPTHWLLHGSLLRVLPGLHPPYVFFGHPPGLYLSLALLYRVLGETIWVSHSFALAFAFLALYFTYRLALHLFDQTTGLLSTAFLFFTPLFFAQSAMVLGDIPVTAFGVMTVYHFLAGNYRMYVLSALCLVLFKETGLAVIIAVLVYQLLNVRQQPGRVSNAIRYAMPLFVALLFFLAQLATTGSLLPNPYFASHPLLDPSGTKVSRVGSWMLLRQGRWLPSVLTVMALGLFRRVFWRREFELFSTILGFFLVTFSVAYFIPRYILPTLPYLCIVSAWSITLLARGRFWLQLALGAPIIALSLAHFYCGGKGQHSFENNMEYIDVVNSHREAASYLEKHCADKRILTSWPLSAALTQPYLGYVEQALTVVGASEEYDVLAYTPQGSPEGKRFRKMIKARKLPLIRRFERKGKFVALYEGH
jgi:4-amino-4-deoxy-L-arabinose transferase-like glycosyltransferase